jgi:replicative DNA helicase
MPLIPPSNLEAEKAILGAIVLDSSLLQKLDLSEMDFYAEVHRRIFKAMVALDKEGIPPDSVTLLSKLSEEDCVRLSDYSAGVVSLSNLDFYVSLLKELSHKRQIQKSCLEVCQGIGELSVNEALNRLQMTTKKVLTIGGQGWVSSGKVAEDAWNLIEKRHEDKSGLGGIPTGLKDLDLFTDGWKKGNLVVLAGRPSTGKSALGLWFALAAAKMGFPVGFISLEMETSELGLRAISALSGVGFSKLYQNTSLTAEEWSRVSAASNNLSSLPLHFHPSARTTKAISRVILQLRENEGTELFLLDYLQLGKTEGQKENREREVAEISWTLKAVAKDQGIPIIALAQLNRDVEKGGKGGKPQRPRLDHLRDSGAIEQDADVVMLLSPKATREETLSGGPLELIIAKGRNIGQGAIDIFFDAAHMRFFDIEKKRAER